MSDMTPSLLDATFKGYRTRFDDAVAKTKIKLTDPTVGIFDTITSEGASEVYGFLDRVPKLREWIGARRIEQLVAQAYELPNKLFELTMGVKRVHIEDNKIGLYNQRVSRMGQQSKRWPDVLAKDALQNGKSVNCFDGTPFFGTAHWTNYGKKTGGSQANLFTTKALTYDNYVAVKQSMRAMLGADGLPLDDFGEDLVLVVDPSNEDVARQIVESETRIQTASNGGTIAAAAAVKNTQAGSARVLVVNSLSNEAGVWYLADCDGDKPMLWQLRYAPDFVPLYDPSSPNVFQLDEYQMGIRARGAAGYGPWWKIARCEA